MPYHDRIEAEKRARAAKRAEPRSYQDLLYDVVFKDSLGGRRVMIRPRRQGKRLKRSLELQSLNPRITTKQLPDGSGGERGFEPAWPGSNVALVYVCPECDMTYCECDDLR